MSYQRVVEAKMADDYHTNNRQSQMDGLMVQIDNLCIQQGLSYQHNPPVQVSPGVWMFYAVPMDNSCSKHGSCRQRQFFAIDVGGKLKLA